ncbi:DEKNAAC103313 [Brettanomyces naardenensis]|uniref:DEKNAAC103313 n=1 Tax=Brettanomyces naardenensis TaxID=13370 RepID=A0A448YNC9_BRENA|nr:DEKNAAC103313 [Brettanomyces naardenensis]
MTDSQTTTTLPKSLSSLSDSMLSHRGQFFSKEVEWAYSFNPNSSESSKPDHWKKMPLEINAMGQLKAHGSVVIVPHVQKCQLTVFQGYRIIKVGITSQKVIFFRTPTIDLYRELLACFIAWQNLKPSGITAKWNYSKSIVYDSSMQANDVLVCRFKVYGPTPTNKKVKPLKDTPPCPLYSADPNSGISEDWFVAIGHLLPTGVLNLLCESDGSILYSVNVASLFSSEIREVHHSVTQTSNVLFLGIIDDLRTLHGCADDFGTSKPFISPSNTASTTEIKKLAHVKRILVDFDLRIDLEDWLVALRSVSALEYVGNQLSQKHLRIVRDVNLEVLEATFDKTTLANPSQNVYCELRMWDALWFRTSIVKNSPTSGCFWKENIDLVLPPGTEYFKILVKASKSADEYDSSGIDTDITIGACFITPNLFAQNQFLTKVPIFNSKNRVLGQLTVNMSVDETHVLPFKSYQVFEMMLINMDISKLIGFIAPLTDSSNLEPWSIMLLDVFQTLHKEHEFFGCLLKRELAPIDSIARSNRISRGNNSQPSSPDPSLSVPQRSTFSTFNTIFRGNSMFSKSLEKYDIRIGQEYLEKLLGAFILQVVNEDLDCECDPKVCPDSYKEHYASLLRYLEILWHRIYITSNDLPTEMKLEWRTLRRNVELSVEPDDTETPLNALSAFIFLRFLCPAILNPQLFNLTQRHHSGRISRTLTLIAKVMMIFSNRSRFQPHKDPSLMKLNEDFIDRHKDEVLVYFDRVTGCKMDFNEKILELSNLKDRLSLNASSEVLNELPTMPYLIDKYLNLAKLAQILYAHGGGLAQRNTDRSNEKLELLGFDDSDLGTGDFLRNLLDESDEEFSNILFKRDFSIKELSDQATLLIQKTHSLDKILSKPETASEFSDESWKTFVDLCLTAVRLTKDDRVVYDQFVAHNPALGKKEGSLEEFLESLESNRAPPKSAVNGARKKSSLNNEKPDDGHGKSVFKKLFRRRSLI